MTFASVARPNASARLLRLAALALPLAMAIGLAVVGAFGSYVSMGLPLRLIHFSAIALAIGAPSFAVSAALRRYVFKSARPLFELCFIASLPIHETTKMLSTKAS